jgi:hypothetical protein
MTRVNEPNADGTAYELLPVAEPSALSQSLLRSNGNGAADKIALGDVLADALFGEVIDISDLISQVLTTVDSARPLPVDAAGLSQVDGGCICAATGQDVVLTILYDDDILTSGGTVL